MSISNAISPHPDRSGWLTTSGNVWTVAFGPAADGVQVNAPEGAVRMTPVRSGEADAAEPEIVSSPEADDPESTEEDVLSSAVPEPGVVRYADVWPGADLHYTVRGHELKEEVLIGSPKARAAYGFDVEGATFEARDDGGLRIAGDLGRRFRVPPPAVTGADGTDLTDPSGARFELRRARGDKDQRIVAAVDPDWLAAQPDDVFPLALDPTLTEVLATDAKTISSSGTTTTGSPVSVGADNGEVWRAGVHFDQYEQWLNQGYRVYFASVGFAKRDDSTAATTITLYDQGPEPTGYGKLTRE